jgi:hypothetical protein
VPKIQINSIDATENRYQMGGGGGHLFGLGLADDEPVKPAAHLPRRRQLPAQARPAPPLPLIRRSSARRALPSPPEESPPPPSSLGLLLDLARRE